MSSVATEPSSSENEAPETPPTPPAASPPSAARVPSRAGFYAVLAAVAIPGSVAALWLAPRPAYPAEMPPLVVPHQDAAQAHAAIVRLADSAPEQSEQGDERTTLYLEHGRQEVRPTSTPDEARARDQRLEAIAAELSDEGTIDAVRAADVLGTIEALGVPGDARLGDKGAFPASLELYGAVIDGRRVAPAVVIESLAWARWNGIHRRPLTEGMDSALLRAYHGWLVFHGPREGTEFRDDALVDYVRAGGQRGLETEGFLRLSRSDNTGARFAFEAAYEASGNLRLRNHALALGLVELDSEDVHPSGDGS